MIKLSGGSTDRPAEGVQAVVNDYSLRIVAAGVLIAILYWARIVFITAMAAVVIALILEPFVAFLTRARISRSVAALIVCLVALTALGFGAFAVWSQLSGIVTSAPAMRENITKAVTGISERIQALEDSAAHLVLPARKAGKAVSSPVANANKKAVKKVPLPGQPAVPEPIQEVRIHDDRNPVEDFILDTLDKLSKALLMSTFLPLLVFFMLSWQDHLYRNFLRFFQGQARVTVLQSLEGIAGVARAFVVGNFIIGVLLAFVSWGLFAFIRLPYPLLAGILSGLLSLVPYAGILLAILPPLLAALATGVPTPVLLLSVAFAAALHLIAMNVLYPTIVGARVHLNPLVVTLALMFWGFLWDAPGLLLAIPITAGLKAVCDHVPGLRNYGRFLGD